MNRPILAILAAAAAIAFACVLAAPAAPVASAPNVLTRTALGSPVGSPIDTPGKPLADVERKPAAFEIRCDREGDAVVAETAADTTVLRVTSPRGIGGATITRAANDANRANDAWPNPLVLRVHLTGLEKLSLAAGDLRLDASVQSHGDHARSLHLSNRKKEQAPVTKPGDYWMDIAAFDAQGKPTKGLPDKGGWFEMTVPRALLPEEEKVLKVSWGDFFRG